MIKVFLNKSRENALTKLNAYFMPKQVYTVSLLINLVGIIIGKSLNGFIRIYLNIKLIKSILWVLKSKELINRMMKRCIKVAFSFKISFILLNFTKKLVIFPLSAAFERVLWSVDIK